MQSSRLPTNAAHATDRTLARYAARFVRWPAFDASARSQRQRLDTLLAEDSVSDAHQPGESTARAVPPPRRSTLTPDYQRDWPEYFNAVKDQPPRDTCLRALAAFKQDPAPELLAIDIACGEGRDTRATLAADPRWRVIATDSSADGLRRLRESLAPNLASRTQLVHIAMESLPAWAAANHITTAHFINASFALPFCDPAQFPALWTWITRTLRPQGRFAGQFFGDRDEWACVRPKSHYTRAQLDTLLADWHIEHLEEVEKEGSDAMGGTKWHHVFHVVARKRD